MLYYDVRFHLHTRRVIKSDFPSFLPSHLKNAPVSVRENEPVRVWPRMISFLPSFLPKKGARARAGERTRAGVTKNDFLPSFLPT